MAFGQTNGPDNGEDVIVIHLGKNLTDEQYNAVLKSIIAFMNARWPNVATIGKDN